MFGTEALLSTNPRARHPYRLTALASGLLLAVAGCTSHAPEPKETVVDLLQQDWQHVSGVAADGNGLRITATGRTIVDRDSGGRQSNPPLNLAGTHLVTEGDFTLEALFSDVTADASWAVYDSPPVIADEFRIEPAGLRLTLDGDDLGVIVFDGSPEQDVSDPSRRTTST